MFHLKQLFNIFTPSHNTSVIFFGRPALNILLNTPEVSYFFQDIPHFCSGYVQCLCNNIIITLSAGTGLSCESDGVWMCSSKLQNSHLAAKFVCENYCTCVICVDLTQDTA